MTVSIPQLGSLLPVNIQEEIPNPLTPWSISGELFARLKASGFVAGESTNAYHKTVVLPTDPEWRFVWKYFFYDCPNRYMIKSISYVYNRHQTRAFESGIALQEGEANKFPTNWHQESDSDLRRKVISRWQEAVRLFSPLKTADEDDEQWDNVKVLPLWHGTKEERCNSICGSGFVITGQRTLNGRDELIDPGYFGKGIYFTNSARYAADIYSDGHLLLSWVSMREPFPVVGGLEGDMMQLKGKGAQRNYNAHYAPVRGVNPTNPYESVYYPCKKNKQPHCDELVVFEKAQTLPRFWVELELVDLYLKKISTSPKCVADFIPHLFKIMQNKEVDRDKNLRLIFNSFLAKLQQRELLENLSKEELQFYEIMNQLLNSSGTIYNEVRMELIDSAKTFSTSTSASSPFSEVFKGAFQWGKNTVSSVANYMTQDKSTDSSVANYMTQDKSTDESVLGLNFLFGLGVPKNYLEAARHLMVAAEQRDASAQYNLGLMYENGWGVNRDEVEAIRLFKRSAEQGNDYAQFNMGWRHLEGVGVAIDKKEAIRLISLAADQGNTKAQGLLGLFYKDGTYVEQDVAKALVLITLAANKENTTAQFTLGLMYAEGVGVVRDEREAKRLITLAANRGDKIAEYHLGLLYEAGTGVERNEMEAVRFYQRSADQGFSFAQFKLGVMRFYGIGLPQDEAMAADYFRLAAEQGHASAQYNLGGMYENGLGVKKDEMEACRLYRLAAKQEDAEAKENLAALEKKWVTLFEKGTFLLQDPKLNRN